MSQNDSIAAWKQAEYRLAQRKRKNKMMEQPQAPIQSRDDIQDSLQDEMQNDIQNNIQNDIILQPMQPSMVIQHLERCYHQS